jgi:hypothetical protein
MGDCTGSFNNCGSKKTSAKCVTHEGDVLRDGELNNCDCNTVYEVIEDIVQVVDKIYPEVFFELEDCDSVVLTKNPDGTVSNSVFAQTVLNEICEIKGSLGITNTPPCEGCIDDCTDDACKAIVFTKVASGNQLVIAPTFTSWTLPTVADYVTEYTVKTKGNYKITIDFRCINDTLATSSIMVGIGINSAVPESGNGFAEFELAPDFTSRTMHFYIRNASVADILKVKFKANGPGVLISKMKVIIEKV